MVSYNIHSIMPFSCFRYRFFYISSKSYHTVAKQAPTSFFDSSFNFVKQNSQLVNFEGLTHKTGKFPSPHPATSATSNYLQLDLGHQGSALVQDDENKNSAKGSLHHFKNPINIVLPLNQGHVILSISSYQLIVEQLPSVDLKKVLENTAKFTNSVISSNILQKRAYHTSSSAQQQQQNEKKPDKIVELAETRFVENKKEESKDELRYYQPSIEDSLPPAEQTPETFLNQQAIEIESAFASGQYEKINSLYMAIKRNDIVPSPRIYGLVLKSICLRTIDDSLDDKLSILLNIYQDMIQQRVKPNSEIYSTVVNELLESSINAAMLPEISANGADFFKIATDIFNASNCSQLHQYSLETIENMMIGMNMYPEMVSAKTLVEMLAKQENFVKNSTYYASLIHYCRFTDDSKSAIRLYEEFKSMSEKDDELNQEQFKIYSSFISTLVHTNEISLATKFFDRILTTIKNYDDYESKITMLLSSYLLALSKINFPKALEIWFQFNSIEWIPEFSFEFYLNFLGDASSDYPTSIKLYNYMVALPRNTTEATPENYFVTPPRPHALSGLLAHAISQNDKTTVLKMLKESFVRGTSFTLELYPPLFQFLNNEELMVKIINNHGLSTITPFEFLTSLAHTVPNLPIFDLSKTTFFKKLVHSYDMQKVSVDHAGFYAVFSAIFKSVNTDELSQEEAKKWIELIAPLVVEFHDLNNYYTEFDTTETIEFMRRLTQFFRAVNGVLNEETREALSLVAGDAVALL